MYVITFINSDDVLLRINDKGQFSTEGKLAIFTDKIKAEFMCRKIICETNQLCDWHGYAPKQDEEIHIID